MNPTTHMVGISVVLIASIAWLFVGVFHDELPIFMRGVMIVIGLFAIGMILMCGRDLFLPFLGYMAYPVSTLQVTPLLPNSNASVKISGLSPKTKIVWWAANPEVTDEHVAEPGHPRQAYEKTSNAGVVVTDANGNVVVHLWCPRSYAVTMGMRVLPKHIHFRYAKDVVGYDGFLSPVHTLPVICRDGLPTPDNNAAKK